MNVVDVVNPIDLDQGVVLALHPEFFAAVGLLEIDVHRGGGGAAQRGRQHDEQSGAEPQAPDPAKGHAANLRRVVVEHTMNQIISDEFA
ncbi:MAG: hypothetical protein E4H17_00415 [Gemmatimonadales bacterium]|nr:MAG: hypothetical protein E4H17_00415 [Gemmatimonadales bacterium]